MLSGDGLLEGAEDHEAMAGPALRELYRLLARVAPRNIPVLVTGETGVGKELFVRRLHRLARRPGQLQVVNCAALPPELAESMLFGHERGAFTGAERTTAGFVAEADRGTLFLDEIGELSARGQAVLLRVLQEGRLLRVGSTVDKPVDLRIVAATHRDLDALVSAGSFRADLLYRLNAVVFHIPPLRERREEIPLLAKHFLRSVLGEWGMPEIAITRAALDALQDLPWPGNVRQLRNVIRQIAAIADPSGTIDLVDLPTSLRAPPSAPSLLPRLIPHAFEHDVPMASLRKLVHEYEGALIADGLRRAHGSVTLAAQLLGVPIRTLSHKMRLHQIGHRIQSILPASGIRLSNSMSKS